MTGSHSGHREHKFTSHAEANAAELAYYHSFTPEHHLDILPQLITSQHLPNDSGRILSIRKISKFRDLKA